MSHALLMTPVRTGVTELECRAEVMNNVNAISWRFAHRYVFASREAALRRVASYFDTEDDRRQPGGLGEVLGADLE